MDRRHDLDWIRVFAFSLLVLYHVGMYYVSWDWHVKSPFASETLEPLMLLSSPWRLSLLFLVSGAATAFLLQRHPNGFLGARSWRLLVPLLFGMLVVVTPQAYYEVVEKLPGGYHDGYLAFWTRYLGNDPNFCGDDGCLDVPTWNHLWFIAYLWVYTVVLWLVLKFAPKLLPEAADRLEPMLSGLGVVLWPVLVLAAARLLLVGRFESTHALVDDWYNHGQYLSLFLLGFVMAHSEGFWNALQRRRWPSALVAMASYGFIVWYFYWSGYDDDPPALARYAQRVAWAINQWTSIAALLGFARQLAPGDSPVLRYLSQAVFPVYILHQTVIVVAAHNLKPLGLTPMLEGPLLVTLSFAVCFLGYEGSRRVGWMRPLFGLKRRQSPQLPQLPLADAPRSAG